jgi:hypothetical protein
VLETYVKLPGRRSLTETPVAVFGPEFATVSVYVTLSPTLGVALSTVLLSERSAEITVILALA